MRKRIAIVLIPSLIFVGILAALILSQFSGQLPAEARDILDSYLEATSGEVVLMTVSYAHDYGQFTAEMGNAIMHAPIEEYRTSPIVYDGDIIRANEGAGQFVLPAQELWCVTLTRRNKAPEYYFLARHDNLYGPTWVLYQSRSGIRSAEEVGCDRL